MRLTTSELATILAALRYFQEEEAGFPPEELAARYAQFNQTPPLTRDEIDSLCERLNLRSTTRQAGSP